MHSSVVRSIILNSPKNNNVENCSRDESIRMCTAFDLAVIYLFFCVDQSAMRKHIITSCVCIMCHMEHGAHLAYALSTNEIRVTCRCPSQSTTAAVPFHGSSRITEYCCMTSLVAVRACLWLLPPHVVVMWAHFFAVLCCATPLV